MGQVIGEFLTNALGVAISPMPLIMLLVILFTDRARVNAMAFTAGWMVGLLALLGIIVWLNVQPRTGAPTSFNGWINVGLGVLFLILAHSSWRSRPRPGHPAKQPGWLSSIQTAKPGTVFGVGAAILVLNAKNAPLIIASGLAITGADLSTSENIVLMLVFAVLGALSALIITGAFLAFGSKVEGPLQSLRAWLEANNAYIMALLFAFLAYSSLGKGLQILT